MHGGGADVPAIGGLGLCGTTQEEFEGHTTRALAGYSSC